MELGREGVVRRADGLATDKKLREVWRSIG